MSNKNHKVKNEVSGKTNHNQTEKFDFFKYDRRALEKDSWILSKLMNGREFKTVQEANDFYAQARNSGMVENFQPGEPEDQAQFLAYEAFSRKGMERRNMAKHALEISDGCTDAYVILLRWRRKTTGRLSSMARASMLLRGFLERKYSRKKKGTSGKSSKQGHI